MKKMTLTQMEETQAQGWMSCLWSAGGLGLSIASGVALVGSGAGIIAAGLASYAITSAYYQFEADC